MRKRRRKRAKRACELMRRDHTDVNVLIRILPTCMHTYKDICAVIYLYKFSFSNYFIETNIYIIRGSVR